MTDEELRARLAEAHRDDAPPPFAAVVGRVRRRHRLPLALALPLAVAVAVLVLWLRRPAPPPSLVVTFQDPLAFLLEPPVGGEVLRSVPAFDRGGELP